MSTKDDVIVAVMGVTGSGKTSFIKTVTGNPNIKAGLGLFSAYYYQDTSEVKSYRGSVKSISYNLIDTPGFNDSTMSNEEVALKIQRGLESTCSRGAKLDALIYIHNITNPRMQGSANRNLRYVRQLLKQNPSVRITLATSFWDQVKPNIGAERESELLNHDSFWAEMVRKGCEVVRIQPDRMICSRVLQSIGERVMSERREFSPNYSSALPTPGSLPNRGFFARIFGRRKSYKPPGDEYASSRSDQIFDVDYGSITDPNERIQEFKAQAKKDREAHDQSMRKALQDSEASYQKDQAQLQAHHKHELRKQQKRARLAQENHERELKDQRRQMLEERNQIETQMEQQRVADQNARREREEETQRMIREQQQVLDQQRRHKQRRKQKERDELERMREQQRIMDDDLERERQQFQRKREQSDASEREREYEVQQRTQERESWLSRTPSPPLRNCTPSPSPPSWDGRTMHPSFYNRSPSPPLRIRTRSPSPERWDGKTRHPSVYNRSPSPTQWDRNHSLSPVYRTQSPSPVSSDDGYNSF